MKQIFILVFVLTGFLYGQDMEEVEAIIDSLEKSLEPAVKTKKIKLKETEVTAETYSDDLKRLSDAIVLLGEDVDQFESEVEMINQRIARLASLDSAVEIKGMISDQNTIYSLVAYLDDIKIITVDPKHHYWRTAPEVLLFSGPIQEGEHNIKVAGVLKQANAEFKKFVSSKSFHVSKGQSSVELKFE